MVGAYVAATIVSLVQYLRLKDRRVLLLVFLFACQASALAREWYDFWKDVSQTGACAAGLLLLLALTLRRPPASTSAAGPERGTGPAERSAAGLERGAPGSGRPAAGAQ